MKLERWGWYSVLVNVLLAGLHGLIAWVSGSLAVLAPMLHEQRCFGRVTPIGKVEAVCFVA